MVVEVDHPDGGKVKMPGNPIKMSVTSKDSFSPPPHLGQHTAEILKTWCNYSLSDIEGLIKREVIA